MLHEVLKRNIDVLQDAYLHNFNIDTPKLQRNSLSAPKYFESSDANAAEKRTCVKVLIY